MCSSSPTSTSDGVAEEQVGEEPPRLPLDGRHARGVDGRGQRDEPDALQDPVRGDRQDQADGRVDAGQRRDEEQGVAERGVLEPVGHPAVGRHGAAADEDGRQEREHRPGRRRRRPADGLDGRPPRHQQDDEQAHVQDVHAGRPAAVQQLHVRRHGRDGQQADEHPGVLAAERRQADRLGGQRPARTRTAASSSARWPGRSGSAAGRPAGTSGALSSSRPSTVRPKR